MVTDTLLFIYAEAHREATESGKRMSGNSTRVLFSLGFIINLKKSVLNSEDRISGFSDRLTENDDLIATAEDQVPQAEGHTPLPCSTGVCPRVGK